MPVTPFAAFSIFDHFPKWIEVPNWIKAVEIIDWTALGIFVVFFVLVYLMRNLIPKTGAIAWVTAKEAMYQPLFSILIAVGIAALFIFLFIPYNTLGEDIKLVISQGLTLIKLICVFLAIWTASTTISDEIEGKTAIMALSKPVGRRTFIIGKYLGVVVAVSLVFLILGTFFLNTVSYKVVYDARESSKDIPTAIECFQQVWKIVPGLVLAFMETLMLAAIAIAISTRLSLLPNLTISLSIYIIGHLMPDLVQSSVGQIAMVAVIADLLSSILPVLSHFSIESVIATQHQSLPDNYLFWAGGYTILYCALALFVSLLLFEDRDLA